MGRKGAILMLAVVVLWTAAPALACLALPACHDCCGAMLMDCDSASMGATPPCCQVQSSGAAMPTARTTVTELQVGSVNALIAVTVPNPTSLAGQRPNPAEGPPPRSLLGASTILRI